MDLVQASFSPDIDIHINTLHKKCPYSDFFESYFPVFGLNTAIYKMNLCFQSELGKMQTRNISNTDTFYAVVVFVFTVTQITQIFGQFKMATDWKLEFGQRFGLKSFILVIC